MVWPSLAWPRRFPATRAQAKWLALKALESANPESLSGVYAGIGQTVDLSPKRLGLKGHTEGVALGLMPGRSQCSCWQSHLPFQERFYG